MTPAGSLLRGSDEIALRPKAMEVLWYLASHAGEVVSKDVLLGTVWPQVVVSDGVLAVCIREIRQALGDDSSAPRYIQTLHRRGYRFIAPVTIPDTHTPSNRAPAISGDSSSASSVDSVTLVGREHELQQLQHSYTEACDGRRQLLFITGETGIGKTALVEAWLQTLKRETDVRVARGECIEQYGAGEAYLPLLDALSGLCDGKHREAVVSALRRVAPNWLLQLPSLLDQTEREALHKQVPGMNTERMLRELVDLLSLLSAEQVLILVLEDLHWSDPSTVEALTLLARHQEPARLLIIGTYRPVDLIIQDHPLKTVKSELQLHGRCTEIVLDYLAENAVRTYLEQRFTKQASAEFAMPIHQRTAGHPLYMVTLVDSLDGDELFSEYMSEKVPDAPATSASTLSKTLPDGLRTAIELQLERLDEEERQVLEIASVSGIEFALATVEALSNITEEKIEALCERLSQRGQFITDAGVATWPDGTISGRYTFRHALYPEVLYTGISSARRVRLHQLVGERLERGFTEQSGIIAADLAHHFVQSHDDSRAVRYLLQAADNTQRRYASRETSDYLRKALTLLRRLPKTAQRDHEELALLLRLGPVLIATQGYAATEVEEVYVRAHNLSKELNEERQLFLTLRGLWVFYCIRADYRRALGASQNLLSLAQRTATTGDYLEAYRALGGTLLYSGRFSEAREYLTQGLALCERFQHNSNALQSVNDPAVGCGYFQACTLWLLGYSEQAFNQLRATLERARKLAHPYTLVCAMGYEVYLQQHRQEFRYTQACAEALLAYASEQGFSYWAAIANMLKGWALAMQDQYETGLAELQRGISTHQRTGAVSLQPYFKALLTEAYARAGKFDAARKTVTEALALANKTHERYYVAELHRLNGELMLLQEGMDAAAAAEACLQQSLAIAHQQQAQAWELRAATSLARLWRDQDKPSAAFELLSPVYQSFTEGLDDTGLQEAKTFLDTLT